MAYVPYRSNSIVRGQVKIRLAVQHLRSIHGEIFAAGEEHEERLDPDGCGVWVKVVSKSPEARLSSISTRAFRMFEPLGAAVQGHRGWVHFCAL